jgi:hypothetical protein
MQQIAIYLKGERDYTKITGSTGPLVYPGAHVWIYKYLYRITDEGRNVQLAQYVFALVYLGTLGVVMRCYAKARVCGGSSHFLVLCILVKMKANRRVGTALCISAAYLVQATS